ncbi:MAG: PstS family phosphate ABC transporter substrate-binding protein [candidate division WOR-3 bacterium]|nr:PstS family phosphate ABC transporter substrate-binding protein [candidate division WOR-3 bacterium]
MKKFFSIFMGIIAVTGIIFAGQITITGSTTVFPIAQKAAEVFMNANPEINISLRGGGSGVGIAALINGQADIANASRPMKTKEMKLARENGINVVENVVARDGLAIAVNPSNNIDKITMEQMKGIYTGEINNWSELGGESMPIVVISRDYSSGTFEVFKKLVLEGAKVSDNALLLASNKAVQTTVADTPGAIGYIGIGYLDETVKALKLNGVFPSIETVNNETYKLARPLFMYTNGQPSGDLGQFMEFIFSQQGQTIVEEVGYIPLN